MDENVQDKSKTTNVLKGLILCIAFFAFGAYAAKTWFQPPAPGTVQKPALQPSAKSSVPAKPVVFQENAIADAVEKASMAVVNIDTKMKVKNPFNRQRFFNDPLFRFFFPEDENKPRSEDEFTQEGAGSGFLISEDGYVLTNYHVAKGATEITVTLSNGKKHPAKLIGSDPLVMDVALLKIKGKGFQVLKLGDSEQLRLGEWVIAIGNPFGQENTVTAGIVSAKRPYLYVPEAKTTIKAPIIQTDAAINPGNSGGPLLNLKGEVVGINTAIASPSGGSVGIGFAIAINSIKNIIDDLKKHGKIIRPWMGVSFKPVDSEIADYYGITDKKGAFVDKVYPDSPAERSGIKSRDIILEVDRQELKDAEDLVKIVRKHKVGDQLSLLIWRDGTTRVVKVKLDAMPAELP